MTKRNKVYKIGMTCSLNIFCGLLKSKILMVPHSLHLCHGYHHYEHFNPKHNYTMDFDTVRPELFIGEDDEG